MKKVLILLLLFIVACGGSSEETVVRDSTTTSIKETTTTTVQDTTTTIDNLRTLKIAVYDDSVNDKYNLVKIIIKKPNSFSWNPDLEYGADDLILPKMQVGEIGEFILSFDSSQIQIPICFSPTDDSKGDMGTIFIVLNDKNIEIDGLAVRDKIINRVNLTENILQDNSYPQCQTTSSTSTTTTSSTTTSTSTTTTSTIPPTPDSSTWTVIEGTGTKFVDNVNVPPGLYIMDISGDDITYVDVNGNSAGNSGFSGESQIVPVGSWSGRNKGIDYISVDAEYGANWKIIIKPVAAARNFSENTISGTLDDLIETYFLNENEVSINVDFTSTSSSSFFTLTYYDCNGFGRPLSDTLVFDESYNQTWTFTGVCFLEINTYGGTWTLSR